MPDRSAARTRTVCLLAQAKVNLGLAVGARRADGYHEVATAMLAVSLADRLEFAPRARGFVLRVDGPEAKGVPTDERNLVLRAAQRLAAELGETRGATIRLTKVIPHGAGLGGGSSDAAATLRGLERLWGRRAGAKRLHAIAAALGSDVPFFLGNGFAMATGRGEILRSLALPADAFRRSMIIGVPDTAISTAMVYSSYEIPKSRLTAWKAVSTLVQLRAVSYFRDGDKRKLVNDLEGVVRTRVQAVPEALRDLRSAGAKHVRMSGSGSAVFGIVPAGASPRAVADRLRRTLHRVYVVRPARAGSRPCR